MSRNDCLIGKQAGGRFAWVRHSKLDLQPGASHWPGARSKQRKRQSCDRIPAVVHFKPAGAWACRAEMSGGRGRGPPCTNQIPQLPPDTGLMEQRRPQLSSTRRRLHLLSLFRRRRRSEQRPDLMAMAGLPHRRHGNAPHRRNASSAREAETGPNPAATAERSRVCEEAARRLRGLPSQSAEALLRGLRIHPQAQRILGNSVAVVALERLHFRCPSFLQPVVSLVRLPCRALAALPQQPWGGGAGSAVSMETRMRAEAGVSPPQDGCSRDEADVPEASSSCDLRSVSPAASWTEPYCPDTSSSCGEPEQDSGFDCDSNPDHPYILFDSGSEEWDAGGRTDSETFYLDPDPDMDVVIELNPQPVVDREPSPRQQDPAELGCAYEGEEPRSPSPEPEPELEPEHLDPEEPRSGAASEEVESEDFCAVCVNGGELLCCDRCPKVYHLTCHIPPLSCFPLGDWACSLCRSDHEPAQTYDCENMIPCGGMEAPYTLSQQDQRRCEKLTLLLCCNLLSAPFHEPVSPLARNYYQVIRRPVDLSLIRRKLDKSNTLHYFTAEQFVDDVLLMFKNCATFNYPDSEVALAGRNLESFFLSSLREIFPERSFASASRERAEQPTRVQWISRRRRRREKNRRKRHIFREKQYYL